MVGHTLGPYTIVSPLGVGGMGGVYRARDSKPGRDAAIEILPSHFTADPERRARFAREARLLATLNHPHIGVTYGLEESDGLTALVLELMLSGRRTFEAATVGYVRPGPPTRTGLVGFAAGNAVLDPPVAPGLPQEGCGKAARRHCRGPGRD